jgi:hypothetical protein
MAMKLFIADFRQALEAGSAVNQARAGPAFQPADVLGYHPGRHAEQPGSPVCLQDFDAAGVRRALAEATGVRTPDWKTTEKSPGTSDAPA